MKRFTETQKWSDPWFRTLKPETKLLWQWILDNCDHAGIIEPDMELASFQIGYAMGMDTLSLLGDRIKRLDDKKWMVVKFIAFQYGVLSEDCKGHNPVFASLKKHGVKGYAKGIHTPQDTDKTGQGQRQDKDRPSLDEVKLCCSKAGLPESDAVWFWNKCQGNGWTNGGKPIKSWPHTIASWKAGNYMPSQKNGQSKASNRPVGGNF